MIILVSNTIFTLFIQHDTKVHEIDIFVYK